jgi:hypothetical protein
MAEVAVAYFETNCGQHLSILAQDAEELAASMFRAFHVTLNQFDDGGSKFVRHVGTFDSDQTLRSLTLGKYVRGRNTSYRRSEHVIIVIF